MKLLFDPTAARALQLAAQGLAHPPTKRATKRDVLDVIRRMGALQIDTIHVVARSPYLVLWSRLGDYEPRWLDELLAEGALFEYWAHEACLLPIEDYPLMRHRMLDARNMGWKYRPEWMDAHKDEVAKVLAYIRENGAVKSADFERVGGRAGWWDWKAEKRAAEGLFTAGELMIARRERFQRVYDLRERVLPDWDDRRLPPIEQVHRELVLRSVKALGVTSARWVADYYRMDPRIARPVVAALAEEGALLTADVEGWKDTAYIHPEYTDAAQMAATGKLASDAVTLLSPFDPIVWDRARAKAMFDFDYRLECYTPEPKRTYGYFVLPILRRGELVGRLDAKAHRKDKVFEVKALYLEPGVDASEELLEDLAGAVTACAAWHRTPKVRIGRTRPAKIAAPLRRALKSRGGTPSRR